MMRAAVLAGPGRLALVDTAVPQPGPGEILLRLSACGICSSDLMAWYVEKKAPFVFGHEPVGVVAALGAGVSEFGIGERVFVHHHAPCGECEPCRRGDEVHCAVWRSPALDPGGMAEYARVLPQAVRTDVLPLPTPVSNLDGTLIEPVACAVKALRRGRQQPGERVFIIGLGFMGQVLGLLARAAGAAWLGGSDPRLDRRLLAESWADAVCAPDQVAGRGLTAVGERAADVVIVTPPGLAPLQQAFDVVRNAGRVVVYAPTPIGEPVPLPLGDLFFREVEIIPAYSAGPDDTKAALAAVKRGVVTAEDLITDVFPFAEVSAAYRRAQEPDALKVVVVMDGEDGAGE